MDEEQAQKEIRMLRHAFGVNGRLQVEFKGLLSRLLREHGVEFSVDLLSRIRLATRDEIARLKAADTG